MPVLWSYLGEHLDLARACERWIAERGKYEAAADLIREVSTAFRQDFIDYIGDLSRRHASDRWWLSSLSEKNPYVTKVFLRACHLLVAERLISGASRDGVFVLVVEDPIVRQNLSDYLRARQIPMASFGDPVISLLREQLGVAVRFSIRFVWFILKHSGRILYARTKRNHALPDWLKSPREGKQLLVLLHEWVDRRSFDQNGHYRSLNFGDLRERITSAGRTCVVVPGIVPTVSFPSAVEALVRSGVPFLLPEQFLKIKDVIKAAIAGWHAPESTAWPLFKGVDLSAIILDDQREDWILGRYASNALLGQAVRRWADAGVAVGTFIYPFESHVWEKAYCLAFRKYFPETRLVGYQNANLPNMSLNFFAAKSEMPLLPLPDVVVTNGRYSFDLLEQSGYSPERLRCGGALRYRYLVTQAVLQPEAYAENQPIQVLVTLSAYQPQASELLRRVLEELGEHAGLRIVVKCHPLLPFSNLSRMMGLHRLPANVQMSDKPMSELLFQSRVLVYTDSTTCLEALAMGVPIIHLATEFGLDFDPLDGFPDIKETAQKKGDLLRSVLSLCDAQRSLPDRRHRGRQLASEFLGPVSDGTYSQFLDMDLSPVGSSLHGCLGMGSAVGGASPQSAAKTLQSSI